MDNNIHNKNNKINKKLFTFRIFIIYRLKKNIYSSLLVVKICEIASATASSSPSSTLFSLF